jgi:hypothetical protein
MVGVFCFRGHYAKDEDETERSQAFPEDCNRQVQDEAGFHAPSVDS